MQIIPIWIPRADLGRTLCFRFLAFAAEVAVRVLMPHIGVI